MAGQAGRRGPVEVTVEDQQKINTFSQLNTRKHELEDMLRVKASESEDLEEAGNELMLVDDEEVPYAVGTGFFLAPVSEAEDRLEAASEQVKDDVDRYQSELDSTLSEMDALKEALYSKLGRDNINLEE